MPAAPTDSPPTAPRRVVASPLLLGVAGLFVATLVASNIIAAKLAAVGPFTVNSAIVIFPLAYLFGDVLTEVWGFTVARIVIWTGFFANAIVVGFVAAAIALPAAPHDPAGPGYGHVLGTSSRLVVASFCAYLVGEFINSIVLARLKVATSGRFLWLRTITSTTVGQALDSVIFIGLAFGGVIPGDVLRTTMFDQWLLKSLYEVVATPVTYAIVTVCKRVEGIDTYDRHTSFAPVSLSLWRNRGRRMGPGQGSQPGRPSGATS